MKIIMEEVFKDIPGHEGRYQVSSLGRIKGLPRMKVSSKKGALVPVPERILKPTSSNKGYLKVDLSLYNKKQKVTIHRLVAQLFLGMPADNSFQVNHIDGNKNNNAVSNLEWCTGSQNMKHYYANHYYKEKRSKLLKDAILKKNGRC